MESKRPSCSCESLGSFHWLNRKSEGEGSGPLTVLGVQVRVTGRYCFNSRKLTPGRTSEGFLDSQLLLKGKPKHNVIMGDGDWCTAAASGSNHVTAESSCTRCSAVSHSGLIWTKSSTQGGETVAEVVEIKPEERSHARVFPLLLGPGDLKRESTPMKIGRHFKNVRSAFMSWGIFQSTWRHGRKENVQNAVKIVDARL